MKDDLKIKVIEIIDKNEIIINTNMVSAFLNPREAVEYFRRNLNMDIDVIHMVERNIWKMTKNLILNSNENKNLQTKLFDYLVSNKIQINDFKLENIDVEKLPKSLQDIIEYVQKNYTKKQKTSALFDISPDDYHIG